MKKIEIRFQNLDDFQKNVAKAVKEGKKSIQPETLIYFESMADFRQFLTFQKIEVLAAIRHFKPQAMYELAKTLDRDFSAVLRDCAALDSTGLYQAGGNRR